MKIKADLNLKLLTAAAIILLTLLACTPPIDITKIWLDSVINNGKPTLVDFAGSDCKPCKLMKPMLEELEKEYRGRANIVIV